MATPQDEHSFLTARLSGSPSRALGTRRSRAFNSLTLPLIALTLILLLGSAIVSYQLWQQAQPTLLSYVPLVLCLLALLATAFVGYQARQQVIIPLSHLRKWSQRIRAGNFHTAVPIPKKGEIGAVIHDVNTLSQELIHLTEEMDSKVRAQTEHIASKSRSLEILYDIATDLSSTRNMDELLEQFLDTMMVLVDARAATVRLLTDNGQTYMVASRGLSQEVIRQEQAVDIQRCLCGKIAQQGGLGIQKGIEECNRFLDCAMIQGSCSELIVVPLQYRDRILGVYNLFLERPSAELGKDVRDLLNSIGMHMGLAIEKARLDDNERRLAIMEERNMIGNELHDSLAQSLVSMRLQSKMLGELLFKKDIRGAQNELRRLRTAVEQAHASLRELLTNFKTGMDERGLVPSIEDLIARFREETGIAVFLQNAWHEFSFNATQEVQVYRIIQEALANIRKHSNACNVRILLNSSENEEFNVLIEDDGLGISEDSEEVLPGEKYGLTIMRERAARLVGQLVIESEPGEGTRVQLSFPANPNGNQPLSQTNEVIRARSAH